MVVAKNSVNSIVFKNMILTGTRHAVFRDILFKFDFKVLRPIMSILLIMNKNRLHFCTS